MKKSLLSAFLFVLPFLAGASIVGTELFPNGDMARLDKTGWPEGWSKGTAKVITANGMRTLVVSKGGVDFALPIKPEYGRLQLSMRMKVNGVELGKESWCTGRMTMMFADDKGRQVGNWPNVFGFIGTTDWMVCTREYPVPKGATQLFISPANLGSSGETFFQDISLKVVRERAMKPADAPLPAGADADPFSISDAWRQTTPTRERICLNGLWAFRPVATNETASTPPRPGDCWGWFKVPGVWPHGDWSAADAIQRIWFAPWMEETMPLNGIDQAWYKRTFALPAAWSGRRVCLDFTMLQTHADIFVDGKKAGELWYPGGAFELTDAFPADSKPHELALLVTARPIAPESEVFMAPDRIIKSKSYVNLRGITGDLYLCAMPKAERLDDAQIITSVSEGSVTFAAETAGLSQDRVYRVKAVVTGCGEKKTFRSGDLKPETNGVLRFTAPWRDARLWDTDTPQNRYAASLTLSDAAGKPIDTLTPIDFAFREFRIRGRDFLLNNKPIHLRLLYNNTANSVADHATESAARETIRRLRKYGFNAIISGNYNFAPGTVSYEDGLLNACDGAGMLLCFTLPHTRDFDQKLDDPKIAARYRKQAEFLIRRVRNRPSVIAYAMNHNSTGYHGDQNPLKIDGIYQYTPTNQPWNIRSRSQALIAANIAKSLDATRPVYHHESGNLSDMHTVNCYLNWAPRQERSDWVAHWAAEGVKPLFFVEWGTPHISSWSSYRGPQFIWRCEAYQSLWAAEFAAQVRGEDAYLDTPEAAAALDHEEALWAKGKPFTWSTLNQPLRKIESNYQSVQSYFINDYLRSHRAYGVSATLPWDQGDLWTRTSPAGSREPLKESLRNLKCPGIVADNISFGGDYINDLGADECYRPSPGGLSMLCWNMPECAFIGGPERDFTEKDHLFAPGAKVAKSLVILNDNRRDMDVHWSWQLVHYTATGHSTPKMRNQGITHVPAGGKVFVPVSFPLPEKCDGRTGFFCLFADFTYSNGVEKKDLFNLHMIPQEKCEAEGTPIHLYDPHGLTAETFDRLHIPYSLFDAAAALPTNGVVVIGREAVDENGLPWFAKLPAAKRVLFFEQRAEILERVFGFRVAERGTRRFFMRTRHPVTDGFSNDYFSDWTGMSTLLTPYLQNIPLYETKYVEQEWCGFQNTRVWRSGTRGNVASALIEKPARGNWLALLDGAFDLQYSPLLECKDGEGDVFFCQLDVTGRTSPDPVGDALVQRLVSYLARQTPNSATPSVQCLNGSGPCAKLLADLGVKTTDAPQNVKVLVAASGATVPPGLFDRVSKGLNVLCLGMNAGEIKAWSPVPLETVHTNATFTRIVADTTPALSGLSNADWAWHGRMDFDAFPVRKDIRSGGALAILPHGKGTIVFWQVPPWSIDEVKKPYLRTSKRHANAMTARLLSNLGAVIATPLDQRLAEPIAKAWLSSYYLDTPVSEDDPYRYYRW